MRWRRRKKSFCPWPWWIQCSIMVKRRKKMRQKWVSLDGRCGRYYIVTYDTIHTFRQSVFIASLKGTRHLLYCHRFVAISRTQSLKCVCIYGLKLLFFTHDFRFSATNFCHVVTRSRQINRSSAHTHNLCFSNGSEFLLLPFLCVSVALSVSRSFSLDFPATIIYKCICDASQPYTALFFLLFAGDDFVSADVEVECVGGSVAMPFHVSFVHL